MKQEDINIGAEAPAGWIFFDGECRFCVANRRRWGRVFERRGFVWVPLQAPGTTERLGVAPEALMEGIWVLPAGGVPLCGVEAGFALMGRVWWLRPVATVLSLPVVRDIARAFYRWVARHRHCIAGRCSIPPHGA